MKPGLYVVATPIGHLSDITFRALETLRAASVVVAEDTRITRRLLQRYEITVPLLSSHKFSEASRAEDIVRRTEHEVVVLVTDSGTPGVSDPGARIVQACRRAGRWVTVLPGPSAVTAALALSGFPADRFSFAGFLPAHGARRARALDEWLARPESLVLFESPHRVRQLAEELAAAAPDRWICVAREMTKMFEETVVLKAVDWPARLNESGGRIRGEFTIVIAPVDYRVPDADEEGPRTR